jgi:hypothetical protein
MYEKKSNFSPANDAETRRKYILYVHYLLNVLTQCLTAKRIREKQLIVTSIKVEYCESIMADHQYEVTGQ